MENWLTLLMFFIVGYVTSHFVSWVMNLGRNVMMTKQTVVDCLRMAFFVNRKIIEAYQIRYLALRKSNRDEDEVSLQEKLDSMELQTMQNSIVKNLRNWIPSNQLSSYDFRTWEEAGEFLKTEAK